MTYEIGSKTNLEGYIVIAVCYYRSDAEKLRRFNLKRKIIECDNKYYVIEDMR
jgi:hypothetical protein